ncbi:MAG: UDP-N-acetylmuramoyl-L-alanine--D-glutamate ligase [Sandaracinaceae bacterium]|nr:UDP-N-acetylmuramoyl-L-alanine--D-glutamate ligase [Sandaracinaceae bacterium]
MTEPLHIRDKRFLVVGLGTSGLAAARLLASRGARVCVNDVRSEAELGERAAEVRALGAELVTGEHPCALFTSVDHIVVSPGVPPLAALDDAERAGVPISSEIELASWFVAGRIVGITGTNGKSTVTTLVGQMCERAGLPTFVGGNLGRPLVEVVGTDAAGPDGVVVVELSSFQLERVAHLRVHVAMLLNVTDDHLDRYADFDAYAAAKARIFERQLPSDYAILPAGDLRCRQAFEGVGAGAVPRFFGRVSEPEGQGVSVVDGVITDARTGLAVPTSDLKIRGGHNEDNACAAALAAGLVGVDAEVVASVLRDFPGLSHRMQHVTEWQGVTYYDDSKATNVGAAVAALDGLAELDERGGRVVLIAGGRDKGGSYQPLVEALRVRGRGAVLIGDATPLLRDAFAAESLPRVEAGSMDAAVRAAAQLAQPGDVVVLAPACSSFDWYGGYAERGRDFQRAARALGNAEGGAS